MATAHHLLHPVRLRIMQTMLGADELTTAQLRERLPDVPPATMYRHVAALAEAGFLEVVSERRVRGVVERGYRVRGDRSLLDAEERSSMTKDDYQRAFALYSGALMADVDRYLARDDADPAREGLLCRQAAVWLTEEECAELAAEIEEVVTRRTRTGPGGGRTRHLVSLTVVPDKSANEPAGGSPGGSGD